MQQLITIDDALLKNATHCLANDDINEVINIALQELINRHSVKRRQPPASIAGKGEIIGDLVAPCVDSEDFACLK